MKLYYNNFTHTIWPLHNGPYILRPSIRLDASGLKLKAVLKLRKIYAENTRVMSLMGRLKMQEILKV